MTGLATLDDYEVRFGPAGDETDKVVALLGDASSKVRAVAGLHISPVVDDEVALDGDGSARLFLPEIPVTGVTSVSVDGQALPIEGFWWWEWGGIDRAGGRWPKGPRTVEVVYSHGWDPVPDWVVGCVCSMVWEALRPAALAGEQSITTGSQTVSYVAARANLYVPPGDRPQLEGLRGPLV